MNKIVLSATFAALFFTYFQLNIYYIICLLILVILLSFIRNWELCLVTLIVFLIGCSSQCFYYHQNVEVNTTHTIVVEPIQSGKLRLKTIDGKKISKLLLVKIDSEIHTKSKLYGKITSVNNKNGFTTLYFHVEYQKDNSPVFREILSRRVLRLSDGNEDLNGFLQAALLGDSQYLSKGFYQEMKEVNGLHLITISGMHVSLVLLIVIYFLSLIQLPYLFRYAIALGILSLYIFAVNFSISVERAYIMGVIYLIAKLLFSEYDAKKSLKIAYILSLIIAPFDIFSASFQLSYVALFAIIYFYPLCKKLTNIAFFQFILLSFIIQLSLQPIFIANFKQMNIFGFINNIILIPFGSLIISFGFISVIFSLIFYPVLYLFSPILIWIFKSFQFYLYTLNHIEKFTFSFNTSYNGALLWIFFILILIYMWYNDEEINS